MDNSTLRSELPGIFRQYIEGASDIAPVPDRPDSWKYSFGQALIVLSIPGGGQPGVSIVAGLGVGVPFSIELARYVNDQNLRHLVIGRMFLAGDFPTGGSADEAYSHIFVEHWIDGAGLSYAEPSSVQNLIYALSSHGAQLADVADEIVGRFGGRHFRDDEAWAVLSMLSEARR